MGPLFKHLYSIVIIDKMYGNIYLWNLKQFMIYKFLSLSPSGWRDIVVTVRAGGWAGGQAGGRAGGCQTCGTHISVTAWWIFSIWSSVELSRPVVVHCHGHLPICPIWTCPWAKNLSNFPQIGSRLCGTHIWNHWMVVLGIGLKNKIDSRFTLSIN